MTKGVTKKSSADSKSSHSNESNYQKMLIENFVGLQKVMTNLSTKFEDLSIKINDLLNLFEESAKTVVKKELNSLDEAKHTEKILTRMDKLFEQNKLIARGLTLMNEFNSSSFMNQNDSVLENDMTKVMIPADRLKNKPIPTPKPTNSFSPSVTNRNNFVIEQNDSEKKNLPKEPPFRDF